MSSSSSSIRLPAYSKQLKRHSVHERGRNRGRGKENKSRENQHVTSETLSTHENSQVMPRSDQNNNRSARTWIVSPTHRLPPSRPFSQKYAVRLCSCQKLAFCSTRCLSYTTISFSLITSQNINLRRQYISSHLASLNCETFPPKKKGGGYEYML